MAQQIDGDWIMDNLGVTTCAWEAVQNMVKSTDTEPDGLGWNPVLS